MFSIILWGTREVKNYEKQNKTLSFYAIFVKNKAKKTKIR